MSTEALATTKYFGSIVPPIDLDKNIMAKDFVPVSPTAIRYYTINAVGTQTGNQGSSGFVFNIIPPAADTVMSRMIRLRMTFRITANARLKQSIEQNANAPWRVFNSAYCGFCALPINSIFSTLTLTINNASTTFRSSQVVRDLLRYDDPEKLIEGNLSETPINPDLAADYGMITNFVTSPFGSFGDSHMIDNLSRNSHLIRFVNNPVVNTYKTGDNINVPVTGQLVATFTEALIVPPLLYSEDWFYFPGFGQLNAVSLNITVDPTELQRIFRLARNSPVEFFQGVANNSPLGGPVVEIIGTPQIIVGFYTLNTFQKVPPVLNYRYSNIVNYITSVNENIPNSTLVNNSLNIGTFSITSQAIQLTSIPRAVVLAVTRQSKTFEDPDAYFPFGVNPLSDGTTTNIINVTFNNESGILSTASVEDLFIIARKNGLNLSYPLFSGDIIRFYNKFAAPPAAGSPNYIVGADSILFSGCGGPLLLLFGVDIPLSGDDYVGKRGLYSFQVTVNCINNIINPDANAYFGTHLPAPPSNDPNRVSIRPQLNVIIIYDGWMRVNNGTVTFDIGLPDGFVPMSMEKVDYPMIGHWLRGGGLQGGSIFGTIGKFVKSIPIVGDVLGGLVDTLVGDDKDEKGEQKPDVSSLLQRIPQYALPYVQQYLQPRQPALLAPAPSPAATKTGGRRHWKKYVK